MRRQDPRTVWTLVDGEDSDLSLINGIHFVNRIGYLISTVAVPEGVDVEVRIPMEPAPETDDDCHQRAGSDPRPSIERSQTMSPQNHVLSARETTILEAIKEALAEIEYHHADMLTEAEAHERLKLELRRGGERLPDGAQLL